MTAASQAAAHIVVPAAHCEIVYDIPINRH